MQYYEYDLHNKKSCVPQKNCLTIKNANRESDYSSFY